MFNLPVTFNQLNKNPKTAMLIICFAVISGLYGKGEISHSKHEKKCEDDKAAQAKVNNELTFKYDLLNIELRRVDSLQSSYKATFNLLKKLGKIPEIP